MKLSREKNRKNLKTENSAGLTELSIGLTKLSAGFFKKFGHFKKIGLAH
jgi:hypothetical protein